tara:strand:+ start:2201 stop:3955 length:1755 start_codon:yes stop_codon:yes gene_type:complete
MVDSFLRFEQRFYLPAHPEQCLFTGPDGQHSVADWLQRVADWQVTLDRVMAQQPGFRRCAVYHNDLAEFSTILMALWSRGLVACVPGANTPGTSTALSPLVDAFAGEFGDSAKPLLEATAGLGQQPLQALSEALDYSSVLLEIFTSGSSGEPQAIPKTLRQMAAEVTVIEGLWGALMQRHCALGTVSHHHIYGILYRLLWPLASGLPMWTHTCAFIEDVAAAITICGDCFMVSSPTHLSRLPDAFDWQPIRQHCTLVLSSGAPLPASASLATHAAIGVDVAEIFGSSETGGIAWRRQHNPAHTQWTPVPGVDVRVDADSQCLQIRSPYLQQDDWYATSDRVEIGPDQSFTLIGRVDKIVKVEGKRLSLTAMDNQLFTHPLISAARSLVLQSRRVEVAAVICLSAAGLAYLETQGRKALIDTLRHHLLDHVERPLLPRRWRIVLALPCNSQGKTLQQDLLELFASRPDQPVILTERLHHDALTLDLQIPADLQYFVGHFPRHPILPGVVQIDWASRFGRHYLAVQGAFCGMKNIKFVNPILPGDHITLTLSLKNRDDSGDVAFAYRQGDKINASGVISFAGSTAT